MMKTVWEIAKETDKPILLYGTGNGADKILDELERLQISIDEVFAGDGFVRNRTFRGFPVLSYDDAKERFGHFLVLLAFGSSRSEVIENFVRVAKEQELYSVDVPVFGDNIFNRSFYEKHRNEIAAVRNMLADEQSVKVFDNVVNFKLTGNIDLLFDCETPVSEAYENILKLNNNEIYMDLGAFNGDTVHQFLQFVDDYKKIYAAEPDVKNFAKLIRNTSEIENIECLNCCICDNTGEIAFSAHGGRNGTEDSKGVSVKCETVDSILGNNDVSYIKFDIEGFELKAIEGASETIKRCKPKMLISCYHRSEDIFSLPLKVMSIRNDYKVYIRHNPYIPAWDTQFYFV
ncbi:MAG: FkbM family methyltransferase [Clostridia bacterium]|nr:FkbM family methyltransferase [Clostridia bacterium]